LELILAADEQKLEKLSQSKVSLEPIAPINGQCCQTLMHTAAILTIN